MNGYHNETLSHLKYMLVFVRTYYSNNRFIAIHQESQQVQILLVKFHKEVFLISAISLWETNGVFFGLCYFYYDRSAQWVYIKCPFY